MGVHVYQSAKKLRVPVTAKVEESVLAPVTASVEERVAAPLTTSVAQLSAAPTNKFPEMPWPPLTTRLPENKAVRAALH